MRNNIDDLANRIAIALENSNRELEEIYEALVGDNGRERYTHEELIEYIYEWKKIEENAR